MFNYFEKSNNKVEISPSIVIFTFLFLALLVFLYLIRSIIVLLVLAFILMVALNPAVTKLEKRLKIPRPVSIGLVYILVISGIIGITAILVPPLASELRQLIQNTNLSIFDEQLAQLQVISLNDLSQLLTRVGGTISPIFAVISSTFSGIFTFFTLLVIAFYLTLDRASLYKKIAWFTKKPEHIEKTKRFIDSLETQLGGWVRGQIILMVVIALVTFIGLALLGVPYALPLALLAGLLEILPNLGPTIAAVPAIIIAFLSLNPVMGLAVLLFYIAVQQLENNLLVPKIMKANADVSPLVAILSILIGLKLYSVTGALLAVPVYIILRTIYSSWKFSKV